VLRICLATQCIVTAAQFDAQRQRYLADVGQKGERAGAWQCSLDAGLAALSRGREDEGPPPKEQEASRPGLQQSGADAPPEDARGRGQGGAEEGPAQEQLVAQAMPAPTVAALAAGLPEGAPGLEENPGGQTAGDPALAGGCLAACRGEQGQGQGRQSRTRARAVHPGPVQDQDQDGTTASSRTRARSAGSPECTATVAGGGRSRPMAADSPPAAAGARSRERSVVGEGEASCVVQFQLLLRAMARTPRADPASPAVQRSPKRGSDLKAGASDATPSGETATAASQGQSPQSPQSSESPQSLQAPQLSQSPQSPSPGRGGQVTSLECQGAMAIEGPSEQVSGALARTDLGLTRSLGTSIRERTRAYEAACKSSREKEPVKSRRLSVTGSQAGRLVASATLPDMPDRPERPLRKLSNVAEQRALKAGVLQMLAGLVGDDSVQPAELPRCASGAPKVLQGSSTLQRLLSNQMELKSSMESDVSAAQSDLRHLTAEQLLSIRGGTLDLVTESPSHSARNSFLETVDKHLFAKLARRCLRGCATPPERPEPWHALGLRITLILGASELLADGWGAQAAGSAAADLPPVPPCWAVRLRADDWPDQCRAALFNTRELWVQLLPGENPDFAGAAACGPIAVFCDRTTGLGKDRMLHWEIAVLNSQTDDVLAEMDREPGSRGQHALSEELSSFLAQRNARTM